VNELKAEKSPYLQQHAANPVHWKAWGKRAFELADSQDRPIFLSIGYSTCHWCHVMERESFERQDIADYLNENFVSIKVDREELPEVDSLYMEAIQVMTQRGGWPLNIFLDHELRPFYGGTYFPPQNFLQVLKQLNRLWTEKRTEIFKVAGELKTFLTREDEKSQGANIANLRTAFLQSSENVFDQVFGGHKGQPKFPMNYEALAMIRLPSQTAVPANIEFYLEKMLSGGIWDHVGGGIHRYSTDEEWRVPHFEKMLYDQASLLHLLTETLLLKENPFLRKRSESLLDYLERDLKMPGGAFYSAEDADSEGVEGKFYVWTFEELQKHLSEEEMNKLAENFEVDKDGNWESNIIFHAHAPEEKDYSSIWKKLLSERNKRPRPLRDEKIICSWNGLMISALARYARTTENPRALNLAKEATDFLLKNLFLNDSPKRRWISGEAKFDAQLDDYAFLIEALRELYLSTMEKTYLDRAAQLQQKVDHLFWREGKGYISNTGENVWRENQEFSDNVTPSAVSTTLLNILWLGEMAVKDEFSAKASVLAKDFPQGLLQFPLVYPRLLEFYDLVHTGIESVAVLLDSEKNKAPALVQFAKYNPRRFIVASADLSHPLLKDKAKKFEGATFYVCRNKVCEPAKANY
jgi:uncharacterized protein YyaL (SSP411 family)